VGSRRLFPHVVDGPPTTDRRGVALTLENTVFALGSGLTPSTAHDDPLIAALVRRHRFCLVSA
jgi:hypothetical protein